MLKKIAGAYSSHSHLAKTKMWTPNVWKEKEENKKLLCITIKTKTEWNLIG